MFGSHLSIAGGLENALIEAEQYGMDCVQLFTKNQRQWKAPPLTGGQIERWMAYSESTGIRATVSHDSYLINLASPDRLIRTRSLRLFREEMLRCDALGIPNLVTHPGAHVGRGEEAGLKRVARALDRMHNELPDLRVVTCLEITAGQGTSLGYTFAHLAAIIDRVGAPGRLGICLDTAHMLAAGYDLTSARGARAVLTECDRTVGLDRVRVLHLNDSKIERGRRVDRHEHIGHGHVSLEAFSVLVNNRKFKRVPKILETPKARSPDGRPWDAVNLQLLRSLVRPAGHRGKNYRPGLDSAAGATHN